MRDPVLYSSMVAHHIETYLYCRLKAVHQKRLRNQLLDCTSIQAEYTEEFPGTGICRMNIVQMALGSLKRKWIQGCY